MSVTPRPARSIRRGSLWRWTSCPCHLSCWGSRYLSVRRRLSISILGGGRIIQIPLRHSRHPGYLCGLPPPPPPPLLSSPFPPVPDLLFSIGLCTYHFLFFFILNLSNVCLYLFVLRFKSTPPSHTIFFLNLLMRTIHYMSAFYSHAGLDRIIYRPRPSSS